MANLSLRLFCASKLLRSALSTNGTTPRFQSSQSSPYDNLVSAQLVYSQYGDPIKVIQKVNAEMPKELNDHDVLVRMIAAPVNPADINTIEGKYPSKPGLPAVAGNEGVAEVILVGPKVEHLSIGDRVVPLITNLGTWRTLAIISEDNVYKVPKSLGIVEAATLTVNPCTAYRMLHDFVNLKPGDSVIQNGANSACGQYAIQIASAWGLNTINIVRNRSDIGQLKEYLTKLGANHVLTEEELKKSDIFKSGKVTRPRLALNCVGGTSALEIMRQLEEGGTMVTYGGMSRNPVTIPTSALIFKNIKVRGFWMTRWAMRKFDSEDRMEMFDELVSMMTSDELRAPVSKLVKFQNYQEALQNALNTKGMVGKKYILEFDS